MKQHYYSLSLSLDLINLYTGILHGYGIESIQFWLQKYPKVLSDCIYQIFVIESQKFVLQSNCFLLERSSYRQKCGITMDTKAAPVLADLVMFFFNLPYTNFRYIYLDSHSTSIQKKTRKSLQIIASSSGIKPMTNFWISNLQWTIETSLFDLIQNIAVNSTNFWTF